MTLAPGARKVVLTAHVTASVGWLGAVFAFLALATAALTSRNVQVVRAADIAMDLIAWFVLVPLCIASLFTGLISALETPWGLLRHYWVLVKLLVTVLATIVLLIHMQPIGLLARVALQPALTSSGADLDGLRRLLITAAGAAAVTLLSLTALSIYKPRGLTRYGSGRQREQDSPEQSSNIETPEPP